MIIRKELWKKGKRYRIHSKTIFGTPDISNKNKRIAVFIDGCFWHGCSLCFRVPKTNQNFWIKKIENNKQRRKTVRHTLRSEGWKVLEFWEHEINSDRNDVVKKILEYF